MQFRWLACQKSTEARWQPGNSVRVDIATLNLKSTESRTAPWETQVELIYYSLEEEFLLSWKTALKGLQLVG